MNDTQLDEIINAPRPHLSTGYGANANLYKHYIAEKFWRYMAKDRMIELCVEMIKRNNLSTFEKGRVEQVMAEIEAK